MTLLSILCVLVIEQIKALPAARIHAALTSYGGFLEQRFNGGEHPHGMAAWGVGVLLPVLLTLVLQYLAVAAHPLLGFLFSVAVLYFAMGLRQFSHFFTDIQLALRLGEVDRARRLLAEWRGTSAERLDSAGIVRLTIEQGIVSSYRHVFAPLFWFMVFGPAGALLYRLGLGMTQCWPTAMTAADSDGERERFGQFARDAFQWIDWVPARLTAATFAIVGDFEDAVYCWRTQAAQWADAASGILLASGAGALGLRLGQPIPGVAEVEARPELGVGDEADIEHLQSAVGLVWRALVLCLLLLALLTVASWVG